MKGHVSLRIGTLPDAYLRIPETSARVCFRARLSMSDSELMQTHAVLSSVSLDPSALGSASFFLFIFHCHYRYLDRCFTVLVPEVAKMTRLSDNTE